MVEHLLVYGYNPSRHLRKIGRRPPSGQSPSATEWAWPIGLRWYPVSAKMSLATQQKHRNESPEPGPNAKKTCSRGVKPGYFLYFLFKGSHTVCFHEQNTLQTLGINH